MNGFNRAHLTNPLLSLSARMHFCLMYRCLISSCRREQPASRRNAFRFPGNRGTESNNTGVFHRGKAIDDGSSSFFSFFLFPRETPAVRGANGSIKYLRSGQSFRESDALALISYRRRIFVTPLWKMEADYSWRIRRAFSRKNAKKCRSGCLSSIRRETSPAKTSARSATTRANIAIILFL